MPAFARVLYLMLPLLLAACAQVGSRPDAAVTGTVSAPPGVALSASVSLRVTLLEVGGDGAAEPVAEVTIDNARLPTRFTLSYDPRAVDEARLYLLQAQLTDGGRLLLLTADTHAVITQGNPSHIDMLLLAPDEGVVPG